MKKIIVFIGLIIMCAGSVHAVTKLDPAFNTISILEDYNVSYNLMSKGVEVITDGKEVFVGCMIKTTDIDLVASAIEELGGIVGSKIKTVLTAKIPLSIVLQLSEMDEVIYIEASDPVLPKMNFARTVANVDTVQAGGGGLPQAYKGSNVMVGIIDSGVDCTHADFGARILNYYDMSTSTDYTYSQILAGDCYSALASDSYHGTHVAGIAAGSDATYTGVAPEAYIVAVQLPSSATETDILNGLSYFFTKADARNVAGVANVSLGTSLGAHDGTSSFETGIDEYVDGYQGRSVVCADGNENVNPEDDTATGGYLGGLHGAIDVAGTDAGYEAIIRRSTGSLKFDVWLDQGGDCSLELAVNDSTPAQIMTTGIVAKGADGSASSGDMVVALDFSSDYDNANNHKQHARVTITYLGVVVDPTTHTYDLIVRDNGGGCQGDVWLWPDMTSRTVFTDDLGGTLGPTGDYTYVNGDSDAVVTIPATATKCLAAASFAARGTWDGLDGEQHQDVYDTSTGTTGTPSGELSYYSSHGPGIGATFGAYRQKPDLTSPGEPIISTLSGNCGAVCIASLGGNAAVAPGSTHVKLQGTSMSAPYMAGVVALLMQKNNCLTSDQLRTALIENTLPVTGATLPDYDWGYGKINALAAIDSISAGDCKGGGGGGGGSGCSLHADKKSNNPFFSCVIFFLITTLSLVKKRYQVPFLVPGTEANGR